MNQDQVIPSSNVEQLDDVLIHSQVEELPLLSPPPTVAAADLAASPELNHQDTHFIPKSKMMPVMPRYVPNIPISRNTGSKFISDDQGNFFHAVFNSQTIIINLLELET